MNETDFGIMIAELERRTEGIASITANLANAAAIIFNSMADVNWAGFYLMENGRLVLGPFQGKPAAITLHATWHQILKSSSRYIRTE